MFKPLGDFPVGYVDFTFLANDEPHGDHPDPSKHLVGGIYYPADPSKRAGKKKAQVWIPEHEYAQGFARFVAGLNGSSRLSFWQRLTKMAMVKVISAFAYLLGHNMNVPAYKGAVLCKDQDIPVVVVSHGVGGQRMVQSCMATELASQGFFVIALESSDGTASAVQEITATGYHWRFFEGHDHPRRQAQILHRMAEIKTALRLFTSITKGEVPNGFKFTNAPSDLLTELTGKLDMGSVTTIGHSFGGGPSCAVPVEADSPACLGIGLDPYWPPLPTDHPVFLNAKRRAALLLIGSQSWNDPEQASNIVTDKELEGKVQEACKSSHGGAGVVNVVMRGIGHASFTDADILFGSIVNKLIPWAQPKGAKKPADIIKHMNELILSFMKLHLPLSADQLKRIKTPLDHTQARSHPAQGISDWELVNKQDAVRDDDQATSNHAPASLRTDNIETPQRDHLAEANEGLAGVNGSLGSIIEDQTKVTDQGEETSTRTADEPQKGLDTVNNSINRSVASAGHHSSQSTTPSRPCKPVRAEEKIVYEGILQQSGIFSLNLYP